MDNIVYQYVQLPKEKKAPCLIAIAFNMTVEFRGLEGLSDSEARTTAKGFNELQHKLLSQAAKELSDEDRYPDETFFAILRETAEMNGILASLQAALARSLKKFER